MKYRLLFFLFVLYSCSNPKQAEPTYTLNHQTIDLGEDFIGYGGFLAFYQDNIVGIDFAPSMQPFFCLKQNTLSYFGNKGQGPNDFLMPYSIQHINNQTFGTWDMMSRTYYEFNIPNENEGLKIDKKVKIDARLSRIIKTAFNQYICLSFDERMFLLTDSIGMPVNTFFEYPYQDNDERKLATRANAYQGILAVNPSKNKFVYSSFQGEIIHFYEIENNNIKTIAKIEKTYPIYKPVPGEGEGVMSKANSNFGYIATYATDNFVYAIFSGKTPLEQGKAVNFEGTILRIFDWKGILVKEYELDVSCSYLCVSDDDSKIWAIASNPDITLVLFELENATEKKQANEPQEEMQKSLSFRDSQLIKKKAFLESLPDHVDAQIVDGGLKFNTDTNKYSVGFNKTDTVINGRTVRKHQVTFDEK